MKMSLLAESGTFTSNELVCFLKIIGNIYRGNNMIWNDTWTCGKWKSTHCISRGTSRAYCEGWACCTTLGKTHFLLVEWPDEQTEEQTQRASAPLLTLQTTTERDFVAQNQIVIHLLSTLGSNISWCVCMRGRLHRREANPWLPLWINKVTGFAGGSRLRGCQVGGFISCIGNA